MKSIRNLLNATLLAAAALFTAGTSLSIAAAADDTTAPPPAPDAAQGWQHHGGPMHLLGKLGLDATQKQQIKEIMTAAMPQMKSLHEQMRANTLKLQQTQPTDANYASVAAQVSQTHGTLAAQMVTQHAEIRAQVFKVLTPAQRTQLTALEAEQSQKHGAWGGPHGPGPDAAPPTAE
jgi:periplasmic protein CpxP/Spy